MSDPITNFVNWWFSHALPGNPFVALAMLGIVGLASIAGLAWSLNRLRRERT